MVLLFYDWVYGVFEIAAFFLALVAACMAFDMFKHSKKFLLPWKFFLVSLILFSFWEIVGALTTFGVIRYSFLNNFVLPFILFFLIIALVLQLSVVRGWLK